MTEPKPDEIEQIREAADKKYSPHVMVDKSLLDQMCEDLEAKAKALTSKERELAEAKAMCVRMGQALRENGISL